MELFWQHFGQVSSFIAPSVGFTMKCASQGCIYFASKFDDPDYKWARRCSFSFVVAAVNVVVLTLKFKSGTAVATARCGLLQKHWMVALMFTIAHATASGVGNRHSTG